MIYTVVERKSRNRYTCYQDPHYVNGNKATRKTSQPPNSKTCGDGGYYVRDEMGETVDRTVPYNHMKVLRSRHMPSTSDSDVYIVDKVEGRRNNPLTTEYWIRWKG